ncbi:MAG: hypothetical protein QNJ55_02430 [Xenococcus sp. MO_188.B8]|nr:hypothetical protein [Xenococcus sp. MO_188.B8]
MRKRRRRHNSQPSQDLESFLDILTCTIGIFILMIIIMTTQAVNQQEVTIVAKTEGENGVNKSKNPRYIECRSNGVILYPGEEFVSQENLNAPNSAVTKLIAEIQKNRDREYLIVAVRSNGIDTFKLVRNLVERAEIDIGYEPIDANWQLKIEETAVKP